MNEHFFPYDIDIQKKIIYVKRVSIVFGYVMYVTLKMLTLFHLMSNNAVLPLIIRCSKAIRYFHLINTITLSYKC